MLDGSDLLDVIKKAAMDAVNTSQPSDFYFGKVVSISPLKIFVEQKMTLGESQLVLTRNVTDFKTQISFDNPYVRQEFTTWNMEESEESETRKISFKRAVKHDVTVYNALQMNDEVVLMKQKGGQKYLVIDRVMKI